MGRHENMPTPQLESSLIAMTQIAKGYAATGPKICEDQMHGVINEVLDELDTRNDRNS